MEFSNSLIIRLSKWYKIDSETGCWNSVKGINSSGYSLINILGKKYLAHRVFYSFYNENFDDTKLVCHKCDNRKCVNPDHLFLGTYSDNSQDRENKNRGRDSRGSKNGNNKLLESSVLEILNSSLSSRKLGILYGVSHRTILNIKKKYSWRHL